MIHLELPLFNIVSQTIELAKKMEVNLDDYFFIVTPSGEVRAFLSLEGFEHLSLFIIKDNTETFADICLKYECTIEKLSLALYKRILESKALSSSSVEELKMAKVGQEDWVSRKKGGKSLRDNEPPLIFNKYREQPFDNRIFCQAGGKSATIQVALDRRWVIQVRRNIHGARGVIFSYSTHVIHAGNREPWDVLKEECGF